MKVCDNTNLEAEEAADDAELATDDTVEEAPAAAELAAELALEALELASEDDEAGADDDADEEPAAEEPEAAWMLQMSPVSDWTSAGLVRTRHFLRADKDLLRASLLEQALRTQGVALAVMAFLFDPHWHA